MNLIDEQQAFLSDVRKLLTFALEHAGKLGLKVTAGELYRTPEQQKIYLSTGRSKTMYSNHLRRLAIDLNFIKDGRLTGDRKLLEPIGEYWESLNPQNRWGGNFQSIVDTPHFERNVRG